MKLKQMIGLGKLYKMFKGKDYDYEALKNNEIFLAYPSTFNDPFDCFISFLKDDFEREFLKLKLPKEKYLEILQSVNQVTFSWMRILEHNKCCQHVKPFPFVSALTSPETDKLEKECWDLYDKYYKELSKIRNQYGIVCFTKNEPAKNMVMWAHYADNYKGFCAQYALSNSSDLCSKQRRDEYTFNLLKHMGKVHYRDGAVKIDCEKILKIPPAKLATNPYIKNYIKRILFTKNKQWNYENEYRLVLKKSDFKIINETSNGFSIRFPYVEKVYIERGENKLSLKHNSIDEITKELEVDCDFLVPSNEWITLETAETHKNSDPLGLKEVQIDYTNIPF